MLKYYENITQNFFLRKRVLIKSKMQRLFIQNFGYFDVTRMTATMHNDLRPWLVMVR